MVKIMNKLKVKKSIDNVGESSKNNTKKLTVIKNKVVKPKKEKANSNAQPTITKEELKSSAPIKKLTTNKKQKEVAANKSAIDIEKMTQELTEKVLANIAKTHAMKLAKNFKSKPHLNKIQKKTKIEKSEKVYVPNSEECTVFVGNLPNNTKKLQVIRLFEEYGPVIAVRLRAGNGHLIFNNTIRKQLNNLIAYVVLKDPETAKKALALNGTEFKGNHLRITLSEKKTPNEMEIKRTVFVGNLKYSATEDKLREIFSSCGEIDYVRCLQASPKEIADASSTDIKTGCKGIAFVCFKSTDAVSLALELKDTLLDDRPINVELYKLRKLGARKARYSPKNKTQQNGTDENTAIIKKKPVFHGVKVNSIKKKKLINKGDKQMKTLAKKIAPKELLAE